MQRALIAASSNGQAAGCRAEGRKRRRRWERRRGKQTPGMCDGTKIEGLGLPWAKLLPSTCSQGGSGSGKPRWLQGETPVGSAGHTQAVFLQWLERRF